MATAMAQAQQQTRRLSITALGLSGSPTRGQPQGPFETMRDRQGSAGGSARPSEGDETAIDEDGDSVGPMNGDAGSRPSSPTARRMSFGARAYRDIRVSTGGSSSASAPDGGGSANSSKGSSPPTAKKGETCLSYALLITIVCHAEALVLTFDVLRWVQLGRKPSDSRPAIIYLSGSRQLRSALPKCDRHWSHSRAVKERSRTTCASST